MEVDRVLVGSCAEALAQARSRREVRATRAVGSKSVTTQKENEFSGMLALVLRIRVDQEIRREGWAETQSKLTAVSHRATFTHRWLAKGAGESRTDDAGRRGVRIGGGGSCVGSCSVECAQRVLCANFWLLPIRYLGFCYRDRPPSLTGNRPRSKDRPCPCELLNAPVTRPYFAVFLFSLLASHRSLAVVNLFLGLLLETCAQRRVISFCVID